MDFRLFSNVGGAEGVSSAAGEEKATEFAPLTLALRGRGLYWHDSNNCNWLRKLCEGSKSGSTKRYISIVPLSTANWLKQTCVKNVGGGFGGHKLREHDYRTILGQWIRKRRNDEMTHGMHKQ